MFCAVPCCDRKRKYIKCLTERDTNSNLEGNSIYHVVVDYLKLTNERLVLNQDLASPFYHYSGLSIVAESIHLLKGAGRKVTW